MGGQAFIDLKDVKRKWFCFEFQASQGKILTQQTSAFPTIFGASKQSDMASENLLRASSAVHGGIYILA